MRHTTIHAYPVRTVRRAWIAVLTAAVMGCLVLPSVRAQLPEERLPLPEVPDVNTPDSPRPSAEAGGQVEAQIERAADIDPRLDVELHSDANAKAGTEGGTSAGDGDQIAAGVGQRARLGVQISAQNGRLMIDQVARGSVAADANLRSGDEILAINGQRVSTQAELAQQFQARHARRTTIHYWRDGRLEVVEVVLMANARDGGRVESFYRGPEGPPPPPERAIDESGRVVIGYGYEYPSRRYYRFRRGCWRR